jgi:hypothetical protein
MNDWLHLIAALPLLSNFSLQAGSAAARWGAAESP